MNFDGFYGNERAKAYLNAAFARNSIPHALLIAGEPGIGKKTLANIIARALVCASDNSPCETCDACYKSKNGIHPDIVRIDGEKSDIKAIRNLKCDALLRPNDSERKVYIIDNAGALRHDSQDAFLKILEEPPHFTFFIILCYNLSDLLPTIVSRAARISLSPLSDEDMLRVIEEKLPDIPETERKMLVKTSGGVCSFLINEESGEASDAATTIASALISRNELDIFKAVSALEKRDRDFISDALKELTVIIRDACVISSGAESIPVSRADSKYARQLADIYPMSVFCELTDHITQTITSCKRNIGVSHITGSLICKLANIAAHAVSKG